MVMVDANEDENDYNDNNHDFDRLDHEKLSMLCTYGKDLYSPQQDRCFLLAGSRPRGWKKLLAGSSDFAAGNKGPSRMYRALTTSHDPNGQSHDYCHYNHFRPH
jgi:hypothetical protein